MARLRIITVGFGMAEHTRGTVGSAFVQRRDVRWFVNDKEVVVFEKNI